MNQTLNQSNHPLNQTMNFNPQSKSLLVSPNKNQQNQDISSGDALDQRINRYIFVVSVLTIFIIWWNIIFIEAFCLLRFACIPDGVETPMFVMKSMFVIFFFTLIFAPTINYVSKHGDKFGVKFFKFVNLALILATIILFIIALSLMGSFGEDDIIVKWSEMSTQEKAKFDDNIQILIDKNKTNLLLHAIYNIVLAILFVLLTVVLYNFDYALPVRWITAAKSRVSFAEDSLIVFSRKMAELEKQEKRRKAIRLSAMRTRNLDLPPINEERTSLMRDRPIPEVGLFQSGYDDEAARNRSFGEIPRRDFDERRSTFGNSPDRNYPRSPDQIPREYPREYDDGYRSRNTGFGMNSGSINNPRMGDIEMTSSNYMGNQDGTLKRRQIG